MWQIGGYIPAVTRGLNSSLSLVGWLVGLFLHCNQLPSAAGLCCEGGKKKESTSVLSYQKFSFRIIGRFMLRRNKDLN